jgi:hypothetical protein
MEYKPLNMENMKKTVLFILTFTFALSTYAQQEKYFGGTMFMEYSSTKPNGGVNVTPTRQFGMKVMPEFGIVNNNDQYFGLGLGLSLNREKAQNFATTGLFGHAAVVYRKFYTDFMLRPFYEVGFEISIGQSDLQSQNETFSARLRGGIGLAYSIRPKTHLLVQTNIARISFFRNNSLSGFSAGLYNFGNLNFGLIRNF